MARVIRMQGFKDWKDGLITTEELLAGKVFREPQHLRKMWAQIIARATGNWESVPHHHLCVCDKCAPTETDRKMKIAMHKAETEHSMKEFIKHDPKCCCDDCIDELFDEAERMMAEDNLAPSDCEPE